MLVALDDESSGVDFLVLLDLSLAESFDEQAGEVGAFDEDGGFVGGELDKVWGRLCGCDPPRL